MTVVRAESARSFVTPNAAMRTLASPALAGSELALWWVEMSGGQAGPEHVLDAEQLLLVLEGEATVELDGSETTLGPGDTAVLPAGATRRISVPAGARLRALATARGGAHATTASRGRVPVPWAA